ncbi:PAS domain S-box protein [Halohasta litorea]|uniref:PAS domain S-box protein n=1 Tax=Halohasta litorea TaxID=869891 RepID=A0ABD6D649_9EURY|nr:PAS domain S-box protein [Halohasta litorea]
MSSDWSVEADYAPTLAVFTAAERPSEPRTIAEISAVLDVDEETVRRHLSGLVEAGELRSKTLDSGQRLWWRPASAVDRSLQDETTYLDRILSYSADYVLIVDETGRVKYNSPPVETMLGHQPEDVVGIDSFANVHPDDRATAEESFAKLLGEPADELTVEFRAKHADGSWRWVEVTGVDKRDDPVIDGALLNVRDVTTRKEQERELRETTRRLQAVLDTIESAVFMKDADGRYLLMNQTCRDMFGIPPEVPVSELTDEELFDAETAAAFRADDRRVFSRESTVAVEEEIPVGDDLRTHLTRKTPMVDDDGESYALCAVATDITEQKARERRLAEQRADLEALNSLNRVFREITDAVLEQSTREEIQETLCTQLAAADSYEAACLGEIDPTTGECSISAQAGSQAVFDTTGVASLLTEPVAQGDAGAVFRTDLADDILPFESASGADSSGEQPPAAEIESFAAVPIGHESTQYGVLGVFTGRGDAFGAHERAVLEQLGEVVGHAIATSERQRALLSDEIIELSFQVEAVFERHGVAPVEGRIAYTRSVPVGDGGFLVYGTASGGAIRAIEAVVESETASRWESLTILGTDDELTRFELAVSDHPVLSTVRAQAGSIHEAVIEDGNLQLTFHFAPNADIQQAIDGVKAAYPAATLLTRSLTVRPDQQLHRPMEVLSERLTDRQLASLEAAYGAGFFNWPRDSSGEALADSLGISPATYHQHLRKAQQTLMEIVFETDSG